MAKRKGNGRKPVDLEPEDPAAPDAGEPAREKRRRLEVFLQQYQGRLSQVLPKHLTPERMVRLLLNECARQPKLLECTPTSILAVMVEVSELGLEIGSTMGLAYPVPRNMKRKDGNRDSYEMRATLVVGYKGLQQLARRSGEVRTISAQVVREQDEFAYEQGSTPRIVHRPAWEQDVDPDGRDVVAAYCVVQLQGDAPPQLEVMNRSQLDGIRERSEAGNSGPWGSDFDEMCRKTVFRRAAKWLPSATDLQRALAAMDRADTGEEHQVEAEVRTAAQPGGALAGLTRRLQATTETQPEKLERQRPRERAPARRNEAPPATERQGKHAAEPTAAFTRTDLRTMKQADVQRLHQDLVAKVGEAEAGPLWLNTPDAGRTEDGLHTFLLALQNVLLKRSAGTP